MENIEKAAMPERHIPQTGVYEHYKSTPEDRRYYQVLCAAKHTETDEILVVYVPMYESAEKSDVQFFVRPLAMFNETVEYEGETIPRFRYIGTEV